jgi:nucleoside-diphosphate kinase
LTEQTLFIIKPDGVRRQLIGEIIARFEQKGFAIQKLKMFTFTNELASEFYSVHKDKPFFSELLSYITSGPVVVCVIEGNNAVTTTRQMVGATKSFEAEPGSIRGVFFAPTIGRVVVTALFPSITHTTTGPDVIYDNNSEKNGLSLCTE